MRSNQAPRSFFAPRFFATVVRASRGTFFVSLSTLTLGTTPLAALQAEATDAAAQLEAIVAEVASRGGDALQQTSNELPPTFDKVDRDAYWAHSVLDRLGRINTSSLDPTQQQTLEILRWDAEAATQEPFLYWYSSPLLPELSPLRVVRERGARAQLATASDAATYLEIVSQAAQALDQIDAQVRGRLARGIVLPAEQIERVLPLLRGFAEPAERHPLWPAAERLAELDDVPRSTLLEELREVLGAEVAPRAAALSHFVDQTLRRHAPDAVGMSQYPGGKQAYRTLVRLYTTLEVTPEEVHRIGVEGVAELNRQMADIRTQLGWTGTKAQFHEHLREDERFYVDEPEQFGERLLQFDARIRDLIPQQFGKTPKAPYTVRRLDPALEGSMTYGFFSVPTENDEQGYYNYNGSELDSRSLLSGAALTYHELVPGHHFQIALQMENEELPAFRRKAYYSGYGEGWGEYSSSVVARELGMYEDPMDLYGRLVFDMFFCVRLVVDTGMNYFGWSRQRAMDYMAEHTMESAVQIDSETIRYSIRTPGQALAYRMGREAWVRLRQRAQSELGERFDVRRFHDSMLGVGSVPLTVLERHFERFLAQEASR